MTDMEAGRASEVDTLPGTKVVDYIGQINHVWTAAVRYARDLCARHPEVTA